MGRSKKSLPYDVRNLLPYNKLPKKDIQKSQNTTHGIETYGIEKRVGGITRSMVNVANPPKKSVKNDAWVEPPVVKSEMDIENMPTVDQIIWTIKVMARNTPVTELTISEMYQLFPDLA